MNRLIIASSSKDADMYYATGMLVEDPFIYVEKGSKRFVLMSDLEYGRALDEIKDGVQVKSYEEYKKRLNKKATLIDVIDLVFKELGVREITVPRNFPLYYADELRKRKYTLKTLYPFYKQRIIKTKEELKAIADAQKANEKAMDMAISMIKKSKVKNNFLYYKKKKLTSELIRYEIQVELLKLGYSAKNTIVCCGPDSWQPHNNGTGSLKPNQPIVIDIFPKSNSTRYFADMTRTVCKGKPTKRLTEIYNHVKNAQAAGLKAVKPGVKASTVHNAVTKYFKKHNLQDAFIHSTGHGVGLNIHEAPHVGPDNTILKEGMVITIEPGLYFKDFGGVRIEDIIVITKNGYKNLTNYKKTLQI